MVFSDNMKTTKNRITLILKGGKIQHPLKIPKNRYLTCNSEKKKKKLAYPPVF